MKASALGLTLAYQLTALKQCLERGKRGIPDAIAGLDMAIESLYSHTDFERMGRKFYHRAIEDKLKPDQAEKLRHRSVASWRDGCLDLGIALYRATAAST